MAEERDSSILSVPLSPEQKARLQARADKEDRSMASIGRLAIIEYLDRADAEDRKSSRK